MSKLSTEARELMYGRIRNVICGIIIFVLFFAVYNILKYIFANPELWIDSVFDLAEQLLNRLFPDFSSANFGYIILLAWGAGSCLMIVGTLILWLVLSGIVFMIQGLISVILLGIQCWRIYMLSKAEKDEKLQDMWE